MTTRTGAVVRTVLIAVAGGIALTLIPGDLRAYGGPGSIISGIGALLAVLAAVAAAIVGFFWFPLKRLGRRLRGGPEDEEGEVAEAP